MLDFSSLKREETSKESPEELVTFAQLDSHLNVLERLVSLETEMRHRITVRTFYFSLVAFGGFIVATTFAAMQFVSNLWVGVLRLILSIPS